MRVLLQVVLMAVDSTNKPRAAVVGREACSAPNLIDSYELLVQFARSVMYGTEASSDRQVHIASIFLITCTKYVFKSLPKERCLVLNTTAEAVHQHDRMLVAPFLARNRHKLFRPLKTPFFNPFYRLNHEVQNEGEDESYETRR